jgi:hypothetical protein
MANLSMDLLSIQFQSVYLFYSLKLLRCLRSISFVKESGPLRKMNHLFPGPSSVCRDLISFTGNNIKHPVHPVYKINIDLSAFMVHHFGSFCSAFACMTGSVFRTPVCFNFRNNESLTGIIFTPYHKGLTNQLRSNDKHIPDKKVFCKQ